MTVQLALGRLEETFFFNFEEIQRKYSPEPQQFRDELKAIGQKYTTIFPDQKL